MAGKVFVSPGFYSSERDLSFVTRRIGVTTLGLVGETTIGPAFQPIFINDYNKFKSFFGGQNTEKFKGNNNLKYELPYVAKSYLSEANQLFVTRILGLSGYDSSKAWGIKLSSNLDESTIGVVDETIDSNLFSFTATTEGVITDLDSSNQLLQTMFDNDILTFSGIDFSQAGLLNDIPQTFQKVNSEFEGIEINNFEILSVGSGINNTITGTTSGVTIQYSGSPYNDVENKIIALLRSRGRYNANEVLVYDVDDNSNISFGTTPNTAINNPNGDFSILGQSTFTGNFDYNLSLDRTKQNYLPKVLGRTPQDNTTPIYVEEFYGALFRSLVSENKVLGVNIEELVEYDNEFSNFKSRYREAVTPWVVSELKGSNIVKLFRLFTISDGNSANTQFKVSITNIQLDTKEFDVEIRAYNDTDARPVILERFTRCSMNPDSINYIARRIGTTDGEFRVRSNYVLVELEESVDTSDSFPAGFLGYPLKDYASNGNTNIVSPNISYKQTYELFENKRRAYLGMSSTIGIDTDMFQFNGISTNPLINAYTNLTEGFHLDIDANTATIDNSEITLPNGTTFTPTFNFQTGNAEFRNEFGVQGTDYERVFARKFTFVPYGGFDGWDIYRTSRTNTDVYTINGVRGQAGLTSGVFSNIALENGDNGINSDYYAYLKGIWTFKNPEQIDINVLATPGIDTFTNTNLVESTIEMVERDRADSIYIVTTPDTDISGQPLLPEDVVNQLDGEFDSNYTATYWPWIQYNDTENNKLVWIPPTKDVVRNIALTDKVAFPWFAVAGFDRGNVQAENIRKVLTLSDRDILYAGRINPITSFPREGKKIWGNKNMQIKESSLDRLNVRRLLLQARRLISAVAVRLLFDQNDDAIRNQFLTQVNPILDNIRSERGLNDFRVELDNSIEQEDRNTLCGKIFIKPTNALEFICVEFNVMPEGASFDDI